MKSLVFTILMVLVSTVCVCQNTKQIDVVYLKNGSMIKGIITELIMDKTLQIKTSDGSLFIFNMSDVEKVIKEEEQLTTPVYNLKTSANKPFKAPLMLGGIVTTGFSQYHTFESGIVNGIYVKEKIALPTLPNWGVGIAFEYRPLNIIGIEFDLMLFCKGFNVNHIDFRICYLSTPLNLLIYLGSESTSFFICFGADYRYLVGSRITIDGKIYGDQNTLFNPHQLGINCGIGFYRFRFTCGWDPVNIWSSKLTNGVAISDYKLRTTSLNFMLSYSHKLDAKSPKK